jgi:hypothetical protein
MKLTAVKAGFDRAMRFSEDAAGAPVRGAFEQGS